VIVGVFHNTFDWTAVGTLALALATGVALVLGWLTLRQTRSEIALSRREVEEAHRPVVVPVADDRDIGRRPARPQVQNRKELFIPIENIGAGPALDLWAKVKIADSEDPQRQAIIGGLGVNRLLPLWIVLHGHRDVSSDDTFRLTVTYADLSGKEWVTHGYWVPESNRWWTTIERLAPDSEVYRERREIRPGRWPQEPT
jgi:hypothetical protein